MDKKYQNKFLICIQCNEEFTFTAEAQKYFAERGFTRDPIRCKTCHLINKKNERVGLIPLNLHPPH